MNNLVEAILDKDETVIKGYKPNKAKFFTSGLLIIAVFTLIFVGTSILGLIFPDEYGYVPDRIWLLIPAGAFVFVMIVSAVLMTIYYKNVFYVYTNKRIIIKKGIFGVDFKSLDMGMIGAINVSVSLIDKILRRNTGSISFGSMASPINGSAGVFKFADIVEPYETFKEIKAVVDAYKQKSK